jgi:hypothetical protein
MVTSRIITVITVEATAIFHIFLCRRFIASAPGFQMPRPSPKSTGPQRVQLESKKQRGESGGGISPGRNQRSHRSVVAPCEWLANYANSRPFLMQLFMPRALKQLRW